MSAALRRAEETGGVKTPRHFLDIRDHDPATLRQMLEVAGGFKRATGSSRPLTGKTLA